MSDMWKTIGRPGWFGEERDKIISSYDTEYGPDGWRVMHQLGPYTLDLRAALHLYELSYETHFLHPENRYIWKDLMKQAKNVWTEEPPDIMSGTDYSIQNAKAAHYEDIAIRRILQKHDKAFEGDRLIRVRADSEDLVGIVLSSIHIPFIFPKYIEKPLEGTYWWNRHKGSLEDFWQTNKILQVRVH